MITILVLGVIIAFAIPNFNDYIGRQRVKAAAQNVAKLLSSARVEALVIDQPNVIVRWNNTNTDITIADTTTTPSKDQTLPPGSMASMDGTNNRFINVIDYANTDTVNVSNDNNSQINFNSLGRLGGVSSGGIFAILFCKERGNSDDAIRVEVSATGRVSQKLKENDATGGLSASATGPTSLNCPN